MSRKIKANKLFDQPAVDTIAQSEESVSKNLEIDENALVGNGRLSANDVEKLQKYDAMEKSLVSMSQEKEQLESKIVEYINQIDALKDSATEINRLKNELDKCKSKCESLEKSNATISALKNEISSLKADNDQYLIKISELTFENAQLTSQLSTFEQDRKRNGVMPNQNRFSPSYGSQQSFNNSLAQPNIDAYNPYINNGYGTW